MKLRKWNHCMLWIAIWPSDSPLADYDKSRKTTMDKYYPQRTILRHLNLFLVRWDMLKLIFDPLRKVTNSYLAFRFTIGQSKQKS